MRNFVKKLTFPNLESERGLKLGLGNNLGGNNLNEKVNLLNPKGRRFQAKFNLEE